MKKVVSRQPFFMVSDRVPCTTGRERVEQFKNSSFAIKQNDLFALAAEQQKSL